MLSYEQILELIDKLAQVPLKKIQITQGDFSLTLSKPDSTPKEIIVERPSERDYLREAVSPLTVSADSERMTPQQQVSAAPAPEPATNYIEVASPMVGTFYVSPSPDLPPFVEPGQPVKEGDILCIIEAMKVMNELPSEVQGTIVEVCVENAQTVEYGQVLFRVKP